MKLLPAVAFLACAACAPNYLDGNDYSYLGGLRCHPDGSLILAQKATAVGKFAAPRTTETAANCTILLDPEWELLRQVRAFEKEKWAAEHLPRTKPEVPK